MERSFEDFQHSNLMLVPKCLPGVCISLWHSRLMWCFPLQGCQLYHNIAAASHTHPQFAIRWELYWPNDSYNPQFHVHKLKSSHMLHTTHMLHTLHTTHATHNTCTHSPPSCSVEVSKQAAHQGQSTPPENSAPPAIHGHKGGNSQLRLHCTSLSA